MRRILMWLPPVRRWAAQLQEEARQKGFLASQCDQLNIHYAGTRFWDDIKKDFVDDAR